jgi:hypothetical protein
VVVRPVIAGALVAPAEKTLEPSSGPATFVVTPVAVGKLSEARVALTPANGKRTEVVLPMRSVRQRLTKLLLLLTLLVPIGLLYLKYEKVEELPLSVVEQGQDSGPRLIDDGRKRPPLERHVPAGPERKPPPAPRPQQTTATLDNVKASPAQTVAYYIKQNLPTMPGVTDNLASGVGHAYEFLYAWLNQDPVPFYAGLALLIMTGASWLAHRSASARRRSGPLQFNRPASPNSPADRIPDPEADQGQVTLIEPTPSRARSAAE